MEVVANVKQGKCAVGKKKIQREKKIRKNPVFRFSVGVKGDRKEKNNPLAW